MTHLNIIVPKNATRHWHIKVADNLAKQGHTIEIIFGKAEKKSFVLNMILRFDMQLFRINKENCFKAKTFDLTLFPIKQALSPEAFVLDLTGCYPALPHRAIQFQINKNNDFLPLATMIAHGELPDLSMIQNGQIIAGAKPMIDNRVSLSRGLQDVLDRSVSFIVSTTHKTLIDNLPPLPAQMQAKTSKLTGSFLKAFITKSLPRLKTEVMHRRKYRSAHWRVGYRFNNAQNIVETGNLSGEKWSVLPDDGTHFYADPFPFIHKKQACIFVEDWCHDKKKAVISVSEIGSDGCATKPIPIIEESWHLSYPQVFSYQNDIWMIPESSAVRNLVLYRAEDFPKKWIKHKILIENRDLSDATLLEHDGKFWLFATDGDEGGSRSDMLVVFQANQIEGPWTPHKNNPIMIDRTQARPGGAFIKQNGKIFLPVQDGSLTYGGGLGLSELTKLNDHIISLSPALPIKNESEWPYPKIHTFNCSNNLEVIDGIADIKL